MTRRFVCVLLPLWVGLAPALCAEACALPPQRMASHRAHAAPHAHPPIRSAREAFGPGVHSNAIFHHAEPIPFDGQNPDPQKESGCSDAGAPLLARSVEIPGALGLHHVTGVWACEPQRSAPRAALAHRAECGAVRVRPAYAGLNPPLLL